MNFLDSNLRVSIVLSEHVLTQLPRITEDDNATRIEHYVLLCGTYEPITVPLPCRPTRALAPLWRLRGYKKKDGIWIKEVGAIIYVTGIREVPEAIQLQVRRVTLNCEKLAPHLRNKEIVGDLHTHPVMADEGLVMSQAWICSSDDVNSVLYRYQRGYISKSSPFVFGIASKLDKGITCYSFYRLIKRKFVWDYQLVGYCAVR